MYETDGQMEIIESVLYPVHDAENKVYIQPHNGEIITSETQKLILSDSVCIPFFGYCEFHCYQPCSFREAGR